MTNLDEMMAWLDAPRAAQDDADEGGDARAPDVGSIGKEVQAEIASIMAGNPSFDDLVLALAVTNLRLRHLEPALARFGDAEIRIGEAASVAQEALDLRNEALQDALASKERLDRVIELLPKAFDAGKKSIAKKGADSRNAENRALKMDAFAWLDANPPRHRGKDEAAAAISTGVVPVKFRTARGWIDEWEKLRASGTV